MKEDTYHSNVSTADMARAKKPGSGKKRETAGGVRHPEHEAEVSVLVLEARNRLAKHAPFFLADGIPDGEDRFPIVHDRAVEPDHVVDFGLDRMKEELVVNFLREGLLAEDHLLLELDVPTLACRMLQVALRRAAFLLLDHRGEMEQKLIERENVDIPFDGVVHIDQRLEQIHKPVLDDGNNVLMPLDHRAEGDRDEDVLSAEDIENPFVVVLKVGRFLGAERRFPGVVTRVVRRIHPVHENPHVAVVDDEDIPLVVDPLQRELPHRLNAADYTRDNAGK